METLQPTRKTTTDRLFMNPLIRKLSKVTQVSEDHATYGGIAQKGVYFVIMIMMGIALVTFLHSYFAPLGIVKGGDFLNFSAEESLGALIALAFFVLTPILAFLIRPVIPFAGTLYCISTGYLLTFVSFVLPEYAGPILLALILTLAIVAVMATLYMTDAVKVDQKFRTVVSTLFWSSVIGSLLVFVCSLIPGLKQVASFLQENALLGILSSLAFIIIASMFLLVDFDTIAHTVENNLPRKYEWIAAFGLVFSVIWLYFKVLDLVLQLQKSKS